MPALNRSVRSEDLLPSVDYLSGPLGPSPPGPGLKLVAIPQAPPASEPAGRDASAGGAPSAAVETEASPRDHRLAALRSLTEEEIIALFS